MSNTMFDEWDLYARILANNYMRHRDISAVVREHLAGMDRSCRVLDLGCGDGWMARECLKSTQVRHYVGIDTSADAIARVRACPPAGSDPDNARIDLYCEDVLTALPALPAGEFDLVLSSYCLHHFSQPQKLVVLRQIRRVLTPDGSFIWTDLARHNQQTRDTYLKSVVHEIRQNYRTLRSEEVEEAIAHIASSDYPEEEQWMLDTARECGFSLARPLLRDEFYGSWAFVAAPVGLE
jgi:ubiquinone/menaquinone biosynthesis C-methylase UbiE